MIVAGLLIPFVINTILEAFMRDGKGKEILKAIFLIPMFYSYTAMLGFLFQEKMPGRFIVILLLFGGMAVYILGYSLAGWLLSTMRSGKDKTVEENPADEDAGTATHIMEETESF